MAQQTVNIGIIENDRRGDTLRVAFNKINENFTELYGSSVSLTAFSVGAEGAASGDGGLAYDNTTGAFTYTPPTAAGIGALADLTGTGFTTLSDVDTVTAADNGKVLYYDHSTTSFKWKAESAPLGYNNTNWDTAYGWGDHSVAGYLTDLTGTGFTTLSDVDAAGAGEDGYILYYDHGTTSFKWKVDSSGLAYTDFSVNQNGASGAGTLTYNNGTGQFDYTPPDLSGFLTDLTGTGFTTLSDVDAAGASDDGKVLYYDHGTTSFKWKIDDDTPTGYNNTNWDTAYGWGDHSVEGYLTAETDPVFSAHTTSNIIDGTGFLKNNGAGTWSYDSNTYLTAETSHADVLVDGDFGSAGIMATDGAGTYSIITDNSSNWNTAYGWGDHSTAGYLTSVSASGNDTEVQFNNSGAFAGDSGLTFDSSGGKTLKVGVGGGTVKANSFQGADSVSNGVTFQSDNGSGVKANHLQIQSHTGSVQTVFPSGAVDFTSAGSVDFTGTTVTGLNFYTDSDVDAHLNQSNPTAGYLLSWSGSDYAWVADTGITTFNLAGNTGTGTVDVGGGDSLVVLGTTGQINSSIAANYVSLSLDPNINSIQSIAFEGSTADANEITLTSDDPAADRTVTLADLSGYIALFDVAPTATITATPAELNYMDGVTSNVQTQLDGKASASSPTFSSAATFNGNAIFNTGVEEAFDTLIGSTGTVTHDCDNGHIFYHTTPSADWTANFTNLGLTAEYGTNLSVIVNQGATAYLPTAMQIGGVGQTINWQGGTPPTGTSNGIDVVSFTILNDGGTYVVLAQMVDFA